VSSEGPPAETVGWNDPPPDVEWNDWGPPQRVRIEHAPVMLFARAVKSSDPVYASEAAARAAGFDRVPVPPTYTFVMTHSGAFPDLQTGEPPPPVDWSALTRGGLYLHGEQHFTYHRQVCVGDVLESRTRTSKPVARVSRRGPLAVTWYQTRWTDPDGSPVVDEQIVSLFFADT
jgi:N-terminal half of MaoC dehydratase